jgi:hypothetical protein
VNKISFVVMTWNRGGQRVTNLLQSLLCYQIEAAHEVVLVDTSDDAEIAKDVARRARIFEQCHLIHAPRASLHKSWALNVGIKATDPGAAFVAATDIDFMFGRHAVHVLRRRARPGRFVLAQPLRLPRDADISDPFSSENYRALAMQATWWGYTGGPGTLQCAARDWWFKVHGYDERYAEGLGGMDDDMLLRARRDGLHIERLTFEEAMPLHQWHEPSPFKGQLHGRVASGPGVVANPDGWGEM